VVTDVATRPRWKAAVDRLQETLSVRVLRITAGSAESAFVDPESGPAGCRPPGWSRCARGVRRAGRPPWSTDPVSAPDPTRRPDAAGGPPRWLLLLLAAGISLVLAAVLLLVLDAAGVESVDRIGFLGVLVVAALAGGWLTRLVAPRLPAVRRPPRA